MCIIVYHVKKNYSFIYFPLKAVDRNNAFFSKELFINSQFTMGPKKEVKKAGGEEEEGTDPAVLLSNYTKFCK